MQALLLGVHAARLFQAIKTVARVGIWIALLAVILAGRAVARDTACPGTIHATSLDPIDPKEKISFSILVTSPENLEIGESFISGLREAGATISPEGSLVLQITFLVTEYSSASPTQHVDFAWMKGRGSPDHAVSQRPTIDLTAGLVKKPGFGLMWVATVNCTLVTSDALLIAHDMGVVLATYFGKQVPGQKY